MEKQYKVFINVGVKFRCDPDFVFYKIRQVYDVPAFGGHPDNYFKHELLDLDIIKRKAIEHHLNWLAQNKMGILDAVMIVSKILSKKTLENIQFETAEYGSEK